ncbi:MAG: hypothetical protein KC619_07970 [Myxococcales bacterium]|nr:hypothetical protein [Myxococcales bacterium]
MTLRYGMVLICVLALAGCDDNGGTDAGGGGSDAGGGGADSGMTDTDSGAMGTDAGGTDAGAVDAGDVDAGDVDAGGGGGGHCAGADLIIEEVDPGTGITIFNPTTAAIDTSTGYTLCQRPSYPTLATIEAGVMIPAGGRHTFAWPGTFADTDAGGEIALYSSPSFIDAAALIDFVCWGTGHTPSRLTTAEEDGDWAGACAGAITGDSLRRIPESDGHGAASYDPTGAAAALTCP